MLFQKKKNHALSISWRHIHVSVHRVVIENIQQTLICYWKGLRYSYSISSYEWTEE